MPLEFDGVNGIIKNTTSDGDVTIKGNDGGSEISALTFDMSAEGVATFNKDIKLGDNSKALFGAASDLEIYHDGSHSYISDQGTGDLRILAANSFVVKKADASENIITANADGAVGLSYDASQKLATTATGIEINGEFTATDGCTITTADNTTQLTLISTDADANAGPKLALYRNSSSPADNDLLGQIRFLGEDDAGAEVSYSEISAVALDVSDGTTDTELRFDIRHAGSVNRILTLTPTEVSINNGSFDSDFRVESNGNDNMFFVDGGNDHVNIGGSSDAGGLLNVFGKAVFKASDNSDNIELLTTDADGSVGPNLKMYRNSSSPADNDDIGIINFVGENDAGEEVNYAQIKSIIKDVTDGTEDGKLELFHVLNGALTPSLQITPTEIVLNESSNDLDFRVESDGNANMLFVDGGNNKVGIGTNSPSELLEIANTSGDPGLRLNGAASGNPLIDFAQNGTQKAYFQYLDSGDAFTYQSDGTHTFQAGGSTEYFRISTAFSGPVSGKFSTFGESAPDCGDGGMTLQQGSNDDNIMTFKSTDVAHARTSVAETDTYAEFKKASSTDGGLHLTTINDAGNVSFYVDAHAREIDTGKGTGDHGTMNFDANTHDGSGSGTSLNSNGNMVTFSNDNSVRFIFDAEGDLHADGSLNASAFDTYEDAQLVRAYDLSHGKGVIASQFDKFVQYNKEDLTDAGLVGRVNHETLKDGTEAKPLINMTGFVRLHNGAIWQQYEKHQKLASAFYKLAEKTIGKEEADKLLTEEEIQLLN